MKIKFTEEELYSLLPNPFVVDNSRPDVKPFDLYTDQKMFEYAWRVIRAYEAKLREASNGFINIGT